MDALSPDTVAFSSISYIAILFTLATGPIYGFTTYYFAGEGWRKSLTFASAISVWGITMIAFVMHWQFTFTNPYIAPSVMLASLIIPSVLVIWNQDYFVPDKLGIHWLVGVQAFRYVGGLYLFEHFRGFIGVEFAYFAGTGDVITAIIASILLLVYLRKKQVPTWSLYLLTIFGIADFVIAYFIGILSLETPIQIFATNTIHAAHMFPIGMIPFLLAPIAMAFHCLMILKIRKLNCS